MIQSNDSNFKDLTAAGLVLVDFYADWCGPCQVMLPRLETLATKYEGKMTVCKHNVDLGPNTPSQLRVMGIPALFLFKDGVLVNRWTGLQEESTLTTEVDNYLN